MTDDDFETCSCGHEYPFHAPFGEPYKVDGDGFYFKLACLSCDCKSFNFEAEIKATPGRNAVVKL